MYQVYVFKNIFSIMYYVQYEVYEVFLFFNNNLIFFKTEIWFRFTRII